MEPNRRVYEKALEPAHTPPTNPAPVSAFGAQAGHSSVHHHLGGLLGTGALAFPTRTDPRRESNHCAQT